MLKHFSSESLKTIAKTFLCDKQPVYYADSGIDRKIHDGNGIDLTRKKQLQHYKKNLTTLKT